MKGDANESESRRRANREAEGTRKRLLVLLKTKGRMGAAALSREVGLTEMAVRRHMYGLQRDGIVDVVPVRQGTGRPAHLYELTSAANELFPKNYHSLAVDLLSELEEHPDTAPLIDKMFQGRRQKLQERYAPRMAGKDLEKRVRELAAIQNAGGYMAEVERRGGRFELHEYNCPIAAVAGKYEQACSCELALFRVLLEAQVERTECLAKGGLRCTYSIGRSDSEL